MPVPRDYLDLSSFFEVDGFQAGISLKNFSAGPLGDRAGLARRLKLDPDCISVPVQTHSDHVQLCQNPGRFPDTDGLVCASEDIVLSIQVADCIPLYLLDREQKYFGLVHGGWRGVSSRIIPSVMEVFQSAGSTVEHMIVLLGPSIQSCCFEVGQEVAGLFPSSCINPGEGDRSFVDLQKTVMNQLKDCGLNQSNVVNSNRCTKCESDVFHSYRRNGKKAGRMIALAGWS